MNKDHQKFEEKIVEEMPFGNFYNLKKSKGGLTYFFRRT
jgi:hypothetical protein